jgi:hypothetical protein
MRKTSSSTLNVVVRNGEILQGTDMSEERNSFEESATKRRSSLVGEFVYFLKQNKKWWLVPILIVLGAMGLLVIATGSGAAPFIYTLF